MPAHTRTAGSKRPALLVNGYEIVHEAIVQDRANVGDFTTATGWAVFGDDTINLAAAVQHYKDTASLEFDKFNGLDNAAYAGAECTIASLNLSRFSAMDDLVTCIHLGSDANVLYAFVRMGTDNANYNEWRILVGALDDAVQWNVDHTPLGHAIVAGAGNGWNPAAVTYLAVGVMFDDEARALADIKFDHIELVASVGHY